MKKSTKIIITLLCVLVVALTLYLVFDMQKKLSQRASTNSTNTNTSTNTLNNSVSVENKVNNIIVNDVTNENTVVNNETDNTAEPEDNHIEESIKEEGNKKLAIKIVKEKWGDDDTVYFTNEGKNDNGELLVAVRSKDTTSIIANFKVNVFSEEATIDL